MYKDEKVTKFKDLDEAHWLLWEFATLNKQGGKSDRKGKQ